MAELNVDVASDPELLSSMHVGFIKAGLRNLYMKSSMDKHCDIYKAPRVMVKVTK